MPLLVALDEYDSALQAIAIHAQIGRQDPSHHEATLRLIASICEKTNEVVADVLPHATAEAAAILFADEAKL